MYCEKRIALLIPARNEVMALPGFFKDVPWDVDRILVLDNGSKDSTADVARKYGAEVVSEPIAGYGRACLAGLAALEADPPDIVAFADADGSDDISFLPVFFDFLVTQRAHMVLAKRVPVERNALNRLQRFGNWLATRLIRVLWQHNYRDLGPMRAITWEALKALQMIDKDYGWTVEMQIRALKVGLRVIEYETPYRQRTAGESKISRSITGGIKAGLKILWVIMREALWNSKPVSAKR
ncbi:MAG: glycosyltransferase family 2 protein [Thermodesulfobacteriota bacterium]|nr:glycosyltransferase family 2 protein [Thermodesulfobacteriota bacterium]